VSPDAVAPGAPRALATVRVQEVGPGDAPARARYDALFESCPDALIQQSSWWADVVAPLGPDEPILLLASVDGLDVGGLPLYVFEGEAGPIVTSVPQAGPMGGVFLRPGLAPDAREEACCALLQRAIRLAEERRALALTLITNPFEEDGGAYDRHLRPDLVLENFTQWVAIGEAVAGDRIILRDYSRRSNLSRNVRKARARGFRAGLSSSSADFDKWYAVHRERHQQLGAAPLREELLRGLLGVLGPRGKAFLVLVKDGDRVVSGCLNVQHRAVVDAFMLSLDADYAEAGVNFLVTEECLLESARRGARAYNWQSSPGRQSGVYAYKAQWGSREARYRFVTRLFAPPARLEALGAERLRTAYAGHYLVPFAALQDGFGRRLYEK
jgi:hypothetical protein